jgi:hypothetical protein
MKPTYLLIDTYEGNITIADNIRTAKDAYKAAYAWIEDTDGECNITFRPRYPAVDPFLEGDIRDQITRAFDDYFGE